MVVKETGKDEIMLYADRYTKVTVTIIAVLLAWNTVGRFHLPAVHAQGTSSIYFVEPITADRMSKQYQTDLATAINGASKGRQLITLIPFDEKYLAVYK